MLFCCAGNYVRSRTLRTEVNHNPFEVVQNQFEAVQNQFGVKILNYGFMLNIGGGHNGHPKIYFSPYKKVNITSVKNQHFTGFIMEKALNFVDTVHGSFFLYYSPYAVHVPITPVVDLLNKY